jgi:hypothetical protein
MLVGVKKLTGRVLFLKIIHYCPVKFDEIPRFARNDNAFEVFAVVVGWV